MRKHPRFAKSISGAVLVIGAASTIFHSSTANAATHHEYTFSRAIGLHRPGKPGRRERRHHPRVRAERRKIRVVAHLQPAPSAPAGGVWHSLRLCESADNYREDSGNGYYGAYQFSLATWQAMGGHGLPDDAPIAAQDALARRLQALQGWGSWPSCSVQLGLV